MKTNRNSALKYAERHSQLDLTFRLTMVKAQRNEFQLDYSLYLPICCFQM